MMVAGGTVGEATAQEALGVLSSDPRAQVVDVRTRPEWMFVGIPALPGGKEPILLEWQVFPAMGVNIDFGQELAAICGDQDAPIFFLCRSGVRSHAAAQRMIELGYTKCVNIVDGFEGPVDSDGHRGNVAGWKASGCPWRQS
ncbi:MAG: rhodanese-like domain-containing protein [Pseudomonadota bacterium]